jgi:hypothetical protein
MPHVHSPAPSARLVPGGQARRWKGRRLLGPDGARIGAIVDVYATAPGQTWGLVRLRRLPARHRIVPLDDARSSDLGVVVPFDRATVNDAPAIESGAPSAREAERVASYYDGGVGEPAAKPLPATTSGPDTPNDELATAEAEARYREERVDLYRAKMYGPRPTSPQHLRELERARDGAEANLRRIRERGETSSDR